MKRELTGEQQRIIADLARDIFTDLEQADGVMGASYNDDFDECVYDGTLDDAAERVIEARLLKFFREGGNV